MSKQIEEELLGWATEALELRHGVAGDPEGKVSLPPYQAGEYAAIDMLQRVRQRLDRVEELQSKARQAKGRIMRLREQADFDAQEAYAKTMDERRNAYVQEYVSAAEKDSAARLGSFNERRQAHQMKRLESFATETLDVLGQCYWGLEKLREDILQMLRLHTNLTAVEVQT